MATRDKSQGIGFVYVINGKQGQVMIRDPKDNPKPDKKPRA